jgi:hypothetical protein
MQPFLHAPFASAKDSNRMMITATMADTSNCLPMTAHYGNSSPVYLPASLEGTLVLKLTITEMAGKRKG